MGKSATEILDEVKAVLGEREGNYDHPAPNFQRIADYWNVLLDEKLNDNLTASDVALMMILMKVAREQFKHVDDNFMDIIGYGVCGLRIAEHEAQVAKNLAQVDKFLERLRERADGLAALLKGEGDEQQTTN